MGFVRYRVNAPKVVAEELDGEAIVINLETGHYYSLTDAGATVWVTVANGGTPGDAVEAVSVRYAGERAAIEAGVSQLITDLARESLIVPAVDGKMPGGGGPGPSSRVSPVPTAAPRPFVAPRLEKYIDMQKLIALDPVLETDESGWPKPDRT
jgi:hypothetical protein